MKTAHQRIQEISKVMKRAVEKAAEKHFFTRKTTGITYLEVLGTRL